MQGHNKYSSHETFEVFSDNRIDETYKIEVEILYDIESNAPEPGHSITNLNVILSKEAEEFFCTSIYSDIECAILDDPEEYLGTAQQILSDEESEEGEYKGDMERERE